MTISWFQAALLGLFACLSSMPGLGGTSIGNYTLGRPLVGGLVSGLILGDVKLGIICGVAMQLVYIALVTPGGTVSADHAAGGIQRFPPGNAGTGAYRDPGKCRTERYEKSSDSGCHDLCGKCRIHDPAASAVDHFIRRKKQG